MKITIGKLTARITNPDGWRHGETGTVLGVVGDTVQIKFADGGSSGFPARMVTFFEKKTQRSLFGEDRIEGRDSVPKASFVMS